MYQFIPFILYIPIYSDILMNLTQCIIILLPEIRVKIWLLYGIIIFICMMFSSKELLSKPVMFLKIRMNLAHSSIV